MTQLKCPYCFSPRVTIISSDATRELVTILCLNCGKRSDLDQEQFLIDTGKD